MSETRWIVEAGGRVRANRTSLAARLGRRCAVLARHALTVLLVVGLVHLTPGAGGRVSAQGQAVASQQTIADLAALMDRLVALRTGIDRREFDLDALALDLAFEDPESITAWVRANIAFQPYEGLLRGAVGTLRTRAGNALDQAVLLATLLNDAGYDARIARGALDEADARALVRGMRPAPLPELDVEQRDALLAIADDLAALSQSTAERAGLGASVIETAATYEALTREELVATSEALAGTLRARLDETGVELGVDAGEDALVVEARDYYWVEYTSDGEQRAAHPAFPNDDGPTTLPQARERLEGTVPDDVQHKLRVQVSIEQRLGSNLVATELLTWERPIALLVGLEITYANAPLNASTWGAVEEFGTVLGEHPVYAPVFDGVHAGGNVFDTNGTVVPAEAAGNQAAGVFREVGRAFEDAAGGLGGLGRSAAAPAEDVRALTAQWIDYTLIAPDGTERTYRRTVLDRLGAAARAAGDTSVPLDPDAYGPLTMSQTFMVGVGAFVPSYVADRLIGALLASRPHYEAIAEQASEPRPDAEMAADERDHLATLEPLMLLSAFEAAPVAEPDVVMYRPSPTLVVRQTDFTVTETALLVRDSVDIVDNARRAYRTGGDGALRAAPQSTLLAGVWETVVEDAFLNQARTVPDLRLNAAVATVRAERDGVALTVVEPSEADTFDRADLSSEARANVREDLRRGFVVVLPEAFATTDEAVWWRIDPVSGTTLGITGDGRGQGLTAYAIVLMSVAVTSALLLAVTVSACTQAIGPRGLRSKEEYAALRWNCVLSGKWAAAAAAIETDVILRRRR